MKIAIFGSRGYLGTQLFHFFARKGEEVVGFDLPDADVTSPAFWEDIDLGAFDRILYFAGLTGTEKSFELADLYQSVNVDGLLNLLKRLSPLGAAAPQLIFPSTRLVYKGQEAALDEDAPKEAKTVYAANKLACESLLEAYHVRYGIPYAVLRICVPFGNIVSHDYSYGTVGFFLKQAVQGGKITLYGDGRLRRTFTHVADVCAAVEGLMRTSAEGVFNLGGVTHTLREAAEVVANQYGASVSFVPWPDLAMRLESGSTYFDSSRLEAVIGQIAYRDIDFLFREEA